MCWPGLEAAADAIGAEFAAYVVDVDDDDDDGLVQVSFVFPSVEVWEARW